MMMEKDRDKSFGWVTGLFIIGTVIIIGRLFDLQVLQSDYYKTLALSAHEIYRQLHPNRGEIFFQDTRNGTEYPAAVNRTYYQVYAVPKEIKPAEVAPTALALAKIFDADDALKKEFFDKLNKPDDLYEAIARKVPEEIVNQIKEEKLPGLYSTAEEYRYYPEQNLAANVLGFCSFDDNGNTVGRYGLEGYWDKILAGKAGFQLGERGAQGNWISLAGRKLVTAEDGADLKLTIDRSLQFKACELLKKGAEEYGAKSAALVMMDPRTGAILAMCSVPDFDPNNYSKIEDLSAFNNTSIFTPYEPGSVFKPITMSAAVDLDLVGPNTTYVDPCVQKVDDRFIHNALNGCYGTQTMTNVLEKSINTGMVWVEAKLGRNKFLDYVRRFGFGDKTGVALDTEQAGNISSLDKKGQVSGAMASFGQGITVTPLQLAAAYSALANGGRLMKPYIVDEIRYPSGKIAKTEPQSVAAVISPRASKLITGMLISVIENQYARVVKLPHYYLAGKTGTAQIAGPGGYSDVKTNHTFSGYAPANDPRFVLVIKYEEPARAWAESTAAVTFKELTSFALQYYGVPEDR